MPGRIIFNTTADGATALTERLRISSTGLATFAGEVVVGGAGDGTISASNDLILEADEDNGDSGSRIQFRTDGANAGNFTGNDFTSTAKITSGTDMIVGGDLDLSDASNVNITTPLLAGTDHTTTGMTAQMLAGGAIAAFDLVCIHTTTQEVVEADASAAATSRVIGIAPAAISDTATGTVLLQGFVRDDTWAWTTGGALYLSETAGAMTHTAPTTDGAFVQVVGVALSPDVVYINPSMDVIEHA
jgi:hypothetical protein